MSILNLNLPNKMNTKQSITLVAILIFALIVGMSIYYKTEQAEKPTAIETTLKTNYMNGCINGDNYAFCNCTFDALIDKLGADGFINFALQYQSTGVLPKEAATVVVSCLK